MKRIYFLILSVQFLLQTVEAQKIWQISQTGFPVSSNQILKYCGDTMISNENWKILEFGRLFVNNLSDVSTQPIGFVKEVNGVVEYITAWNGVRKTLYNYNLNIGDTVILQFMLPTPERRFLVEAKDTIVLSGNGRRLLKLRNLDYPYNIDVWVEGIGSVRNHFLRPGEGRNILNDSASLTCFQEDNILSIWGDSIVGACKIDSINVLCSMLSSTEELDAIVPSSRNAYPNPFESLLNIDIDGEADKLEIYSHAGRRVLVQYFNTEKESITLNLDYLNSGIYAILFYGKNGETEYKSVIKVR